MSDGLMIILVIVVWLFVLAPLLLRGQRPINKTGEAFDDTRVVYEGGSGDIPARRHPRVLPKDVRSRAEEDDEDYELVEALTEEDDLLIDERRTPPVTEPVEELVVDDPRGEVVDGEVVEQPVAELPQGGSTASREHPGMRNYAPGQSPQGGEAEPDEKNDGQREEPMIGFRLPEHERPDRPENPTPSDDDTTQIPRVIDPLDAADNPDLKLPDASPRPPQDPDSPTTKE